MTQRGEGSFKTIAGLAVVAYGILCAVKLVPAWTADKEIAARTAEILKFASVHEPRLTQKDIVFEIQKEVKRLNLPLKDEQVTVTVEGSRFHTVFEYDRKVNLIVYTYQKHVKVEAFGDK